MKKHPVSEKWILSARKKMLKAAKKRLSRKTPYPFGFEYNRERK
tara:strand:+ start:587 stop:718 length:132 start_codon:yes stop_codon:yes gene_type:complete